MIKEEYRIPEIFISYLVNGDSNSLTNEELDVIDNFLNEIYEHNYVHTWSTKDVVFSSHFSWRNDVNGMEFVGSNIVDMVLIKKEIS